MSVTEFDTGCGIFVRVHNKVKGETTPGHEHNFPHLTRIVSGKFHVKKWSRIVNAEGLTLKSAAGEEMWMVSVERDFQTGDFFLVDANCKHEFLCLEDGTYHCEYANRTAQGEIVERYTGWAKAYT